MLRDDLICSGSIVFLLCLLCTTRVVKATRVQISCILLFSFFVLISTRPQLVPLYIIAYLVYHFFSNLSSRLVFSRKLLFISILSFSSFALFLQYEVNFVFDLLSFNPLNFINVPYRYFLSPAPWNIPGIISGLQSSDAAYSPLWFLLRFFLIFYILILFCFETQVYSFLTYS